MESKLLDDEPVKPPPLSVPLRNTSSPKDQEPVEAGLEELRKWQQQRLERRLRGEYESQVKKLVEVVNGNFDKPTHIASVRIEGADKTRSAFLDSLIRPHFQPSSANASLADVIQTTREINHLLNETGIFNSVKPELTRGWSPLSGTDDVDIVFRCKEAGKWFLRTATDIGNQEGSASATARVRNAFGGAETIEGNMSFGTKTKRAFQLRLEAPVVSFDPTLQSKAEISVFQTERDYTSFASVVEDVKGVKLAYRTPWRQGAHEFAYEATSRKIGSLSSSASLSMREAAGHTIKSALQHTYLRDTRDDAISGTRGSYTKISHELAGFGGDATHLKSETAFQLSRQLGSGLSLSLSSGTGLLFPVALYASRPATASSLFSDRFQVGGPLSVRSFKQNGLGPRDGADSLGGDLYWSAGLSLFSDIPQKPHWPLKLHAFVNAGRLDAFDRSKPIDLIERVKQSISTPSISAGVGLIYRFDPVRVEVNFGVPLVASKTDLGRKGFQVGMGLEFL